jgi:hypothetical protein
LVDCLLRDRPAGRLDGCRCPFGDECPHTRTRRDKRWPHIPYQTDYLFASAALAERLLSCQVLPEDEWGPFSDHFPSRPSSTSTAMNDDELRANLAEIPADGRDALRRHPVADSSIATVGIRGSGPHPGGLQDTWKGPGPPIAPSRGRGRKGDHLLLVAAPGVGDDRSEGGPRRDLSPCRRSSR